MPEAEIGEIKVFYQEAGRGFPVIFIHGLSDDANLWAPLLPDFSGHYRAIAVDVRGHGRSGKPDMPYTISMFSDDLYNFMNRLGIAQANMVGLSMGAAIIQQFTLEHPEMVRSIVLLSAFACADTYSRARLIELRDSIAEGGLPAFFDKAIGMVVTPAFISANYSALGELKKQAVQANSASAITHAIDACVEFDVRERAGEITAPALLLSGKEDVLMPVGLAGELHKAIKGSQWVVMEGVGHNLLVPDNIKAVTEIVLEFLKR